MTCARYFIAHAKVFLTLSQFYNLHIVRLSTLSATAFSSADYDYVVEPRASFKSNKLINVLLILIK